MRAPADPCFMFIEVRMMIQTGGHESEIQVTSSGKVIGNVLGIEANA